MGWRGVIDATRLTLLTRVAGELSISNSAPSDASAWNCRPKNSQVERV